MLSIHIYQIEKKISTLRLDLGIKKEGLAFSRLMTKQAKKSAFFNEII